MSAKLFIGVLLAFTFCLSAFGEFNSVYGQIQPDTNQTKTEDSKEKPDKNKEIADLLEIVRDKTLTKENPKKVIVAIDRLGDLKATEAIDDLTGLLTLDRGPEYFNPEIPPPGGIIGHSQIYPAIAALSKIGAPALPAIFKVIEENDPDEKVSQNAWFIILALYSGHIQEASKLLREAAGKAATQDGSLRLLAAADKFDELERRNKIRY